MPESKPSPASPEPEQPSARSPVPEQPPPAAPEPPPAASEPPPAQSQGPYRVYLRIPCPRCGSKLAQDISVSGKRPITCSGRCRCQWPDLKDLIIEVKARREKLGGAPPVGKSITLNDIKNFFCKGQAGVRGLRNVAERMQISMKKIRSAIDDVYELEGRERVSAVGDNLETVIQQGILAVEDIQEALKGKINPVPPPDEEEPPPERPVRRRRRVRRR